MEARLDRDKQELKEHIDQAHQRLDQKVSSLERRTQGQLSELTRCVVAERALCDQRHLHLAQWLNRGTAVRNSERVRGTEPPEASGPTPVPRARSLEHLLDHQTEWKDQHNNELPNGNIPGLNKGLRNGLDHRSLEMLADDDSITSWQRSPHRNSAHEIPSREQKPKHSEKSHENKRQGQLFHTYAHELALRLKQGFQKSQEPSMHKQEHNKSLETLLDRDVTSWRSQPHRRSAHEIPASRTNIQSTNEEELSNIRDRHNRSFDTLLDQRTNSWRDQPHYRSVNELPASQHQRINNGATGQELSQASRSHNHSFDVLVDQGASWNDQPQQRRMDGAYNAQMEDASQSWKEKMQQETKEIEEQRQNETHADDESVDWRGQPLRRSVHEMVARFQSAQTGQVTPNWKIQKQKSVEAPKVPEVKRSEEPHEISRREHDWQSQGYHRGNSMWQGETINVHGNNHYRCHDDNSSESSDGEDEEEGMLGIPEPGNPDYENVAAACQWRVEESRLMSGLPYRSRSAVYSPTHEMADLHNDSGYSTKLYGSSKGPSPSLSGNTYKSH